MSKGRFDKNTINFLAGTQDDLATDKITSVGVTSQLQNDSGKRQKIAFKQTVQNLMAVATGALLHAFLT